jgi:cytochrome c biogenesis factor
MVEILLLLGLVLPQTIAGIFARSQGRKFWFWFFISFLIPIISLVVLVFLDDKSKEGPGFKLADHVHQPDQIPGAPENEPSASS